MAPSSRATYSAGTRRFQKFCHRHGVPHLPANRQTLAHFAAELSRSLAPSTISVYLSAVGSLHRQAGLRDPTRHNPILQLAKRGIRRMRAAPTSSPRRPITPSVLADLLSAISQSHSICRHDRRMLTAAFTLAFFGFMRVSEFTVPSRRQFNPHIHPTLGSICWGCNHFTYHLVRSKTDQNGRGHSLRIPRVGGPLCPFLAMSRYTKGGITARTQRRRPLFFFASGRPLTRLSFLHHLRHLLQVSHHSPKDFNTHSFRIGAATTSASAGTSSALIKHLGRWRSSAYQRYIMPSNSTLARATRNLAQHQP